VVRREGASRSQLAALVPRTIGEPVPLTGAAKGRIALPAASEPEKPWPPFLRDVRLVPDVDHGERLALEVRVEPEDIEGAWSVSLLGDVPELSLVTVDGRPEKDCLVIPLSSTRLEQLLRDEEVRVRWWSSNGDRTVPINVDRAARDALPILPGSTRPGESLLLAYYQGRIAFEDLYPEPESVAVGSVSAAAKAELSGVDTSRIQSYQLREFVEALKGVRGDLETAAKTTPRAMERALRGAVSPLALARLVVNEVTERRRTATAGAFQLFEVLCCLFDARLVQVTGSHASAWRKQTEDTAKTVDEMLAKLLTDSPEAAEGSFRRYERKLRAHYRSSGAT